MGGKDPNVRTEFLLDTYLNVAKKMFPGIVMHHRMSLLDKKHEEENMRMSRYPVGGLSEKIVRCARKGKSSCKFSIRVVEVSMFTSVLWWPV